MRWTFFVLLTTLLTSCNNILTEFAQTTDNSLLYQAQMEVDNQQWTSALTTLALLSPGAQTSEQALNVKASAYAGRCGLNFIQLASDFSNIGATLLFPFLLKEYKGATAAQVADCESAETALRTISTTLTADENVFLIFVELAKIGVILAADADPAGNGSYDAGFNACSNAGGPPVMSDIDAGNVATAISNIQVAANNLGSANPLGTTVGTAINAFCTVLAAFNPGAGVGADNFCGQFNPVAPPMTANQLLGIRSVIQEGQVVGLGSCAAVPNSLPNCICP